LTSGALTLDSSTPTLTGNFNEHPIYFPEKIYFCEAKIW
jgi:hypothetical protein